MSNTDLTWQTEDGLSIVARQWLPGPEARAIVALVHGLGEHSGRYQHVAGALNDAGFAVLAADLRGHGRSGGRRGHAPDYETLVDDVAIFIAQARRRFPGRPHFLYGHSLGGGLVLNYVLRHQPSLSGVVATAPLLRLAFEPPAWKLALARLLSGLWPRLAMSNGLDAAALSHASDVAAAYGDDPLVHDRLTARLGWAFLEAGEWTLAHAGQLSTPLLLMHGTGDTITSHQASVEFAHRAGRPCTLRLWDGLFHELHNESQWRHVVSEITAWMETRLPLA